jgi:hypothetical protein
MGISIYFMAKSLELIRARIAKLEAKVADLRIAVLVAAGHLWLCCSAG